jgi:hypothetical protein
MTHSAFTAIPVHPATQAAHLADLAAKYRQVLAAEPGRGRSRTVKQLAKMTDAFETQARTLLEHRTDDGVWFQHLGCDLIMADFTSRFPACRSRRFRLSERLWRTLPAWGVRDSLSGVGL